MVFVQQVGRIENFFNFREAEEFLEFLHLFRDLCDDVSDCLQTGIIFGDIWVVDDPGSEVVDEGQCMGMILIQSVEKVSDFVIVGKSDTSRVEEAHLKKNFIDLNKLFFWSFGFSVGLKVIFKNAQNFLGSLDAKHSNIGAGRKHRVEDGLAFRFDENTGIEVGIKKLTGDDWEVLTVFSQSVSPSIDYSFDLSKPFPLERILF